MYPNNNTTLCHPERSEGSQTMTIQKLNIRPFTAFWATCVCLLILASCKSPKTIVQGGSGMHLTNKEQLAAVINNSPVFESFSSRLRMTVPLKKGDYTLNGTLKMQRDELIQISLLLPIIRTEAARIEISPDRILVIDRMNRRYALVPIHELREIFQTEVDFQVLQAFFSNTIYVPTGKRPEASRNAQVAPNEVLFEHKSKEFKYSFLTSLENNRLVSSAIEPRSLPVLLQWQYSHFQPVGNTTFPSEMTVLVGKKSAPTRTTMELSRMSVDKQSLTPSEIPSRYEKMGLSDIIKILQKL